ncbi:MAG: hypothetical protein Kow0080_34840 [Candidatus Promineifilaceae bacterium]
MARHIQAFCIRLIFRLLYYELAWSYDVVSWLVSFGQWRAWLYCALPFVTGNRVLELGHGPGHLLLALSQLGKTAVGLDLSPVMGRQARHKLQKQNAAARLVRGKGELLPFANDSFDTVVATFPTNYIFLPETLSAVRRVLRQNGRFVIIPSTQFTGNGAAVRLLEWLYHITGQRQLETAASDPQAIWQPVMNRFTQAGFAPSCHQKELKGSIVTILVAEKE